MLQHPNLSYLTYSETYSTRIFTSRSKQTIEKIAEAKPEVPLGMHAAVNLDVVVNLHGHLDPVKLERKAGVCYSA